MIREDVVTVASWCFAPVGREEWEEATEERTWSAFVAELGRCARAFGSAGSSALGVPDSGRARPAPIADRPASDADRPISVADRPAPVAADPVPVAPRLAFALERVAAPPSFEQKTRFAAEHFTGGLPASALPVESLYTASPRGDDVPGYCREPALYMRELVARLGLSVPTAFSACPDHLSLELETLAVLLERDEHAARDFMANRFRWLGAYERHLESIDADATFYAALVTLLIGVFDAWCDERE